VPGTRPTKGRHLLSENVELDGSKFRSGPGRTVGQKCLPFVRSVENSLKGSLEVDHESLEEELGLLIHSQCGCFLELSVDLFP